MYRQDPGHGPSMMSEIPYEEKLRLECLRLALSYKQQGATVSLEELAERFERYVRGLTPAPDEAATFAPKEYPVLGSMTVCGCWVPVIRDAGLHIWCSRHCAWTHIAITGVPEHGHQRMGAVLECGDWTCKTERTSEPWWYEGDVLYCPDHGWESVLYTNIPEPLSHPQIDDKGRKGKVDGCW